MVFRDHIMRHHRWVLVLGISWTLCSFLKKFADNMWNWFVHCTLLGSLLLSRDYHVIIWLGQLFLPSLKISLGPSHQNSLIPLLHVRSNFPQQSTSDCWILRPIVAGDSRLAPTWPQACPRDLKLATWPSSDQPRRWEFSLWFIRPRILAAYNYIYYKSIKTKIHRYYVN